MITGSARILAEEPRRTATTWPSGRPYWSMGSWPAWRAHPGIDITVIVSFNRNGDVLGHPRITYESEQATDDDRLQYRIAVMEALQRCTPMPFTESMAGAVAGRPFAIQFHHRKPPPPATEKRAWLTPKIL